jgi:hypothetical protein
MKNKIKVEAEGGVQIPSPIRAHPGNPWLKIAF